MPRDGRYGFVLRCYPKGGKRAIQKSGKNRTVARTHEEHTKFLYSIPSYSIRFLASARSVSAAAETVGDELFTIVHKTEVCGRERRGNSLSY